MDELDSSLKKLAALAKSYPQKSRERAQAVTQLLMLIQQSDQLYCPGKEKEPQAYEQALQDLRIYIFRKIDTYDPTQAKMMTWVNMKLKYTFKDAIRKHHKKGRPPDLPLSMPLNSKSDNENMTLQSTLSDEKPLLPSEQLKILIEKDFEGVFKSKCIRGRPEINFKAVSLKFFAGYSKREIADEYAIKEQTLYSFYSRSCIFFKDYFTNHLIE